MASCPETGISLPECSCRSCCENLVNTYAPNILTQAAAPAWRTT